ncbi:MAG: TonB C-terminal domain-containing protein, partial [Magnetococcales bacterium]|nr:TonB C-terminal domain-containing protein [Magnetococcales bacterium]
EKPAEKKPPEKPAEKKPAEKKPEEKKPEEKKPAEEPLDFSKAIAKYQKSQPKAPPKSEEPARSAEPAHAEQAAAPAVSPFAITRWQRGVTTKVRDNWRKPGGLRGEAALEVIVRVQVGPDGALLNPRVTHPSGNPVYDESVMRAISKTVSVESPPAGCAECRELDIRFRPELE